MSTDVISRCCGLLDPVCQNTQCETTKELGGKFWGQPASLGGLIHEVADLGQQSFTCPKMNRTAKRQEL